MSSSRDWMVLVLFSSAHVAANLRLSNLDATLPPLPSLTLKAQASGFSFDLYSALSPASSTSITNLSDIPGVCTPYVGPGQERNTNNMTATNITFEDCGDPFTVCRCSDATMSMDTIVDRLGRVPIGLRRYIGIVFALNGGTGPSAFTHTTGDMHLWGDYGMDMGVHEATHAFDLAPDTAHSSAPGWSEPIANDTCVPDTYSLHSRGTYAESEKVHDFAQMSVIKIYMLLYDGHLPAGFRADCMSHHLDFMASLPLYNASALFGNTCHISDGLPGARRDTAPPTLDPARVFATVVTTFPTASVANSGVEPTYNLAGDHLNGTPRLGHPAVLSILIFAATSMIFTNV
ncbi:hypothetical protein B0H16DRAFT_1735093 [Mycena metata]|uniref:Conidiation-specific protein 13 n=1 Tax=Mycena metata TaxID=1033252 RepID=A0AAD7HUH1_9AGAR|nr:hypothetical protein B0H16DRAFT_1735093 [Mycena metata]